VTGVSHLRSKCFISLSAARLRSLAQRIAWARGSATPRRAARKCPAPAQAWRPAARQPLWARNRSPEPLAEADWPASAAVRAASVAADSCTLYLSLGYASRRRHRRQNQPCQPLAGESALISSPACPTRGIRAQLPACRQGQLHRSPLKIQMLTRFLTPIPCPLLLSASSEGDLIESCNLQRAKLAACGIETCWDYRPLMEQCVYNIAQGGFFFLPHGRWLPASQRPADVIRQRHQIRTRNMKMPEIIVSWSAWCCTHMHEEKHHQHRLVVQWPAR